MGKGVCLLESSGDPAGRGGRPEHAQAAGWPAGSAAAGPVRAQCLPRHHGGPTDAQLCPRRHQDGGCSRALATPAPALHGLTPGKGAGSQLAAPLARHPSNNTRAPAWPPATGSEEPDVTSAQRGVLLVRQTHGQRRPFGDLRRKGRADISDGALGSASPRSWGRPRGGLGDGGAAAALPQTSSAPALPSLPSLETGSNSTALRREGILNAKTR